MIKYIVFMFGLLLFSSCNENESESFITKEMKNYIGTFIKYYKISQLIHTQIIAN